VDLRGSVLAPLAADGSLVLVGDPGLDEAGTAAVAAQEQVTESA
jgi:hypothetical protein